MKRKVISKDITLNNPRFKIIVQQSADERKDIHEQIVQGAKDAGIIEALTSSEKKNNHPPSVTISGNTAGNRKALTDKN